MANFCSADVFRGRPFWTGYFVKKQPVPVRFPSARPFFLRRQAARPPKKTPARVNAQIMMVTAYSLVVIMCPP